jgi:hypothetical protein
MRDVDALVAYIVWIFLWADDDVLMAIFFQLHVFQLDWSNGGLQRHEQHVLLRAAKYRSRYKSFQLYGHRLLGIEMI